MSINTLVICLLIKSHLVSLIGASVVYMSLYHVLCISMYSPHVWGGVASEKMEVSYVKTEKIEEKHDFWHFLFMKHYDNFVYT